jgi:hypothetical protein
VSGNKLQLTDYMAHLPGGRKGWIIDREIPTVISTRACVHCGKPYQITAPYEHCNPGIRDLCDDCLIKGVKLP